MNSNVPRIGNTYAVCQRIIFTWIFNFKYSIGFQHSENILILKMQLNDSDSEIEKTSFLLLMQIENANSIWMYVCTHKKENRGFLSQLSRGFQFPRNLLFGGWFVPLKCVFEFGELIGTLSTHHNLFKNVRSISKR